jgi:hypothetical protein
MPVPDSDFPQLFVAADLASSSGQKLHLRGMRARLILVVGAAACGIGEWRVSSSHDDLLGLLALVLFVLALLVEGALWKQRPERDWYDGRALAESVKTLAWKFAVGGHPFPITMPVRDASKDVTTLLDELRAPYRELTLSPVPGEAVTPWMLRLRNSTSSVRRDCYIADRVEDQQNWYSKKARQNARRAGMWRTVLVCLELLGAAAALVESLTRIGLHFTPTLAAAVGAVAAWLETKQHEQISRAYSTTVADLGNALTKLKAVPDEEDWAREMNDTEDAISREHTLWLAYRSQI